MSFLPVPGVLGGNFPFPMGPLGDFFQELASKLFTEGLELFGSGEQPNLPTPPDGPRPDTPAGQGDAQDRIDEVNASIAEIQQQLAEMHEAAGEATDQTGRNSDLGRSIHDQILSDGSLLGAGLAPQGGLPEADAGRLAAMQQQIDDLTNNVADKAGAANGIADTLRNLGGGIPGLGMGGGPGLGMPGLGGGLPGLSTLGGGPGLGAPTVSSGDDDALDPPEIAASDEGALEPPHIAAGPESAAVAAAAPPPDPAAASPAAAAPAATADPVTAETPETSKDITLPGGHVVAAPNPAAAAAVRNAVNNPAGTGDVATTAYAGTDVEIPTDGADPGRKVDPADVAPGDIAVFDDHTALVAGNGQLVGPDGKLQPLGIINDSPGFKGFFRPTEAEDLTAVSSPDVSPDTAPEESADPAPATVVAAVPGGTTPPATDTDPGFGLPGTAPDDER